jgi:hypothetical protein
MKLSPRPPPKKSPKRSPKKTPKGPPPSVPSGSKNKGLCKVTKQRLNKIKKTHTGKKVFDSIQMWNQTCNDAIVNTNNNGTSYCLSDGVQKEEQTGNCEIRDVPYCSGNLKTNCQQRATL